MSTTATTWLGPERDELAATRILDAAGALFAARGVGAVDMTEIAAAAGCSRATLYRYFADRHALRAAFVQREARRLGAAVAARIEPVREPARRLEVAVLAAVEGVRSTPTLAAWFRAESAGTAAALAGASEVIEELALTVLDAGRGQRARDRARFVVRVIVSLLAAPGRDAAEERRLVRDLLVPAVLAPVR